MVQFFSAVQAVLFALTATPKAANIPIHPITNVYKHNHTGYFSDPFHVPYESNQGIYISGTTPAYLECGNSLEPKCATKEHIIYNSSAELRAQTGGNTICNPAGIHPFQTVAGNNKTWDALVTLHVQNNSDCGGIGGGWSVIVHAHPANATEVDTPPKHWIGDKLLVGSFSDDVDANYDGKYFRTPEGKLYLVYSKRDYSQPKRRDGVAAWPMDDPQTKTPGSQPTFLLLPHGDFNSEDYVTGRDAFKLVETGNIRAVRGKFVMAYSAGAFFNQTYKVGIAYSDTFLPPDGQYYRQVLKDNPDGLWGTKHRKQEVYYLLQADQQHPGWHYVGDQVKSPGVPTVAQIGPNGSWVLTFAGYAHNDHPKQDHKYEANHRRPFFIDIHVNVPENKTVKDATDAELQKWIVPVHKGGGGTDS